VRQGVHRRGTDRSHVRPLTANQLADWQRLLTGDFYAMTEFNRQLHFALQRRALMMAARGLETLEPELK